VAQPRPDQKKAAAPKDQKKAAEAKPDQKKPAGAKPDPKKAGIAAAADAAGPQASPPGEKPAAEPAPSAAPAPAKASPAPPAAAAPPASPPGVDVGRSAGQKIEAGQAAVWPPPVTEQADTAPVTAPAPATAAPGPALARDGHPLAGYQNGHFYLRDATDNFRVYPSALLLLDGQAWAGPGVGDVSGSAPSPRLLVRAARLGLGGEVLQPISWQLTLAADGQPLVNGAGTNELAAAPPGQAPDSASARYAPAQTAGNSAGVLDAWINLRQSAVLNLMLGQYRTPFTMANATPLSALPFHERPLSTRAFGNPEGRDIGATVWGDVQVAHVSYWVGLYGGDGRNRPGVDRRADLMARVTWSPFAGHVKLLEQARIGVSARTGNRQGDRVNYDYPALRTQQGFAFWRPVYTDSLGRRVHVLPADAQGALAFELWVPIQRFELQSEVVLLKNETREAVDGYQSTNTERIGTFKGAAGYVQVGYTILGKPHLVGAPGGGVRPRTLDFTKQEPLLPAQSLEVLLRVEALGAKYQGASRGGQPAAGGGADGKLNVGSLGLGLNYWATRHVRMSANWLMYSMPKSDTSDNRAVSPGNIAGHSDAHVLHELGVRAGVMF
jgi:phosphate-selective porin